MSNVASEGEVPPPPTIEIQPPMDAVTQPWNIWERDLSKLHYKGIDIYRRILELFDARIIRIQSATDRSMSASLEINMRYVKGGASEVTGESPPIPPQMKPGQDYIYNVWQRYTNLCAQGRRLFDVRKAGQGQYRPLRTEVDAMKQQMKVLQEDLAHYELLLKEAKAQFNRDQPPARLCDPPAGQDRLNSPDNSRRDSPADNAGAPDRPYRRPRHGGVCTFDCGFCLALHLGVLPTREREATAPGSGRETTDWPITHEVIPANMPLPRNPNLDGRAESDAGYNEDLADTSKASNPPLPLLPPRVRSDQPARTDTPAQRSSPPVPGLRLPDITDQTRGPGLRGGDRPTSPICIIPFAVISIESDEDSLSIRHAPSGQIPPPPSTISSNSGSTSDHTIEVINLELTSTNDSGDSRTLVGSQSPPSIISIGSSRSNTSSSNDGCSSDSDSIYSRSLPRSRPVQARPPENAQKTPEKPVSISSCNNPIPPADTGQTWRNSAWYPPPPSVVSISSSSSRPCSSSSFDFNGPVLVPSTTPTNTQNQPQRPQSTTISVANPVPTPQPNIYLSYGISSSRISQPSIPNQKPVQATTTRRTYIENPLLTPPLDIDLADFEFADGTRKASVPPGNVSKHAQLNPSQHASNGNGLIPPTTSSGGILRGPTAGLGFKNVRFLNDSETDSLSSGSSSGCDRPGGFSDPTSGSDVSLDLIISRRSGKNKQLGHGQSGGQRATQKGGQKGGQQQKLWTKPVPFMHGGVHVNLDEKGKGKIGASAGSQQNGKNRNQGNSHKGDRWTGNQQHGGGNGNDNGMMGNGSNGRRGQKRGSHPSW